MGALRTIRTVWRERSIAGAVFVRGTDSRTRECGRRDDDCPSRQWRREQSRWLKLSQRRQDRSWAEPERRVPF